MWITRDSVVAVIGVGAMGTRVAQVTAQAGHNVVVVEAGQEAEERSRSGTKAG